MIGAVGAPQKRPHTADELQNAEGLGEVIVRPGIQPFHNVQLAVFCGDQQHGQSLGGAVGAQGLQNLNAAFTGQHPVQNHKIRLILLQGPAKRITVSKGANLKPGTFQCVGFQIRNAGVVFY